MRQEITIKIGDIDYQLEIETKKTADELKEIVDYFQNKLSEVRTLFLEESHTIKELIRAGIAISEELFDYDNKNTKFTEKLMSKLKDITSLLSIK